MRTKLFFLLVSFFPLTLPAALKVVTSTEDLASLAKTIGGENVEVSSLVKGTQDPHFIEARPSFLVTLNGADLLIAVGLGLEEGWLPLLQRRSNQPKIMAGGPGYLDASKAIEPIEVDHHSDRSQGDVHPEGNPHFMADPNRGLKVAALIKDKLVELDKAHSALYVSNFDKFQKEFTSKIQSWKKRLAPFKDAKVFGYHKSFNYFFGAFNLNPVAYLEPKPGLAPTAKHLLKLIELAKTQKVKLIVMEDYFDPKAGLSLQAKTGAKLIKVPAYTGGHEKAKTYSEWLELLISEIETSLK